MEYISTRNNKKTFTFKDVFLKGLAPDGGLFIPNKIKKYSQSELKGMAKLNYIDLATKIASEFCGNDLKEKELRNIIKKSYSSFARNPLSKDFIKLHKAYIYAGDIIGMGGKQNPEDSKVAFSNIAELYHGPTLSFKDFAMQPIGNIYEHFLKTDNKKINIIVATSGDTGSAAIAALKGKSNINVFVLHPNNKISNIQRKLMTTVNSRNVFNIAIKGSFDDCQRLVKDMFADKKFSEKINMSAVNSINWARIIFQIVYYFFIGLKFLYQDIAFSIPTGNFGNVYAGYVAKKMGLPIKSLIIATNKNDILDKVITSGEYRPSKTKPSISPSMDIQTASNFERLLYDVVDKNDKKVRSLMNKLKNKGGYSLGGEVKAFFSHSILDRQTKNFMKEEYNRDAYHIDPHTATAYGAVKYFHNLVGDYYENESYNYFILATADPCKFSETVKNATGIKPKIPKSIKNILNKKENYAKLENNIDIIQNYILKKI